MAITQISTPVTQPDSNIRRTFRVAIEREGDGEFSIVLNREIVPMLNGARVAGGSEFVISRSFSRVAAESVTLADGSVVTVAQVAEAIAIFGDNWDRADSSL